MCESQIYKDFMNEAHCLLQMNDGKPSPADDAKPHTALPEYDFLIDK